MTRPRDSKGRFIKTLTAAASVIPTQRIDQLPRSAAPWQEQAWKLWRILGVLHYPTSFMADQVGRVDWDVSVNGELLEPEQAEAAMAAVTSPIGVSEAARRIALNLEVAGEVWYARKSDDWQVYGTATPKRTELLKGADVLVRVWLADPTEFDKPDSPVRAALDVAEEIRVMSALSRAQTRSRVGQRGILWLPKEAQFPEGDDFKANLETHLSAPIGDEYSPSAVIPLKVDFPADLIEKVKHTVIESPYDDKLQERIDNAIKRLALSLNMPPEVLLGNIDSNHWNAWISEESTYRAHIEPLAMLTGQAFAKAMMEAAQFQGTIEVTPDPSELLARRQSVADSFQALRMGVVGFEYVRKQMGADEEDAPSDEELQLILLLNRGNAAGRAVDEIIDIPALGTGQVEVGPPKLPQGNGQVTAAVEDDSDEALDRLGRQMLAIDMQLLGTLRGETRMAVEMARERNDSDEVGVQQRVANEMQRLGRAWRRDISDAHASLRELGIQAQGPEWDQAADASVDKLVDGMTRFVTDNLDKPDSELPALPTLLLREVMAAAGGSNTATVAAVGIAPTFADPQGFAIGVLSLKDLKAEGIALTQWRFRYGQLSRENPFEPHKEQDGRFASVDGEVSGWFPGDHL